jgi:hypothetical protein
MGELYAFSFSVLSSDGGRAATVVIRPQVDPSKGWVAVPRDLVDNPARCRSLQELAHLWQGSVSELFAAVRSAVAA